MARADIYTYHKKEEFPSHNRAITVLLIVFGAFFAWGFYSLWALWNTYGAIILAFIQGLGLPTFLTENVYGIVIVVAGLVILSLLMAFGASAIARRLGGTLINIGAIMLNLFMFGFALLPVFMGIMTISELLTNWGLLIPGLITLFITLLLFTVWKDRVRRAGEIIKLTGQVCLDEKGVFVPPLTAMLFTLVSALMFGAIILQFTPLNVILGVDPWTLETGLPFGIGLVLYLFTTIFIYNFAYGTTSAIVYIYMRGRDPTLGDGIRSTLGVIGGIAILSLMSVIVVIVRMILQRLGRQMGGAGRVATGVASGVIGWVWALLNYFTIPAMVAEELGAKDGIKRSAGIVRKNFVDVIIKETAVRWAFGVLAVIFFFGFAIGGALIGWVLTGDILLTFAFAIVFIILAGIPSTLILRTFDIVYVTLLYVFIRKKEGDFTSTKIPSGMQRQLTSAYDKARKTPRD